MHDPATHKRAKQSPSFASFVRAVAPHLPPKLVCPESLARIDQVATLIPGILAFRTFGFECPLTTADSSADFLVSLSKDVHGPPILSGQVPDSDFFPGLFRHPVWQSIRRFGEAWSEPASVIHDQADDVWLEFDTGRDAMFPPVPNLFFAPMPVPAGRGQTDPDDTFSVVEAASLMLSDRPFAFSRSAALRVCLDNLEPYGGRLFQVGFMVARSTRRLRLCLRFEDPDQAVRYLSRVGWPGEPGRLAELLEDVAQRADVLALDLDMGDGLTPMIGVETWFDRRRQPGEEPRWRELLDWMCETGLCRQAKARALFEFPGRETLHPDHPLCPQALSQGASLFADHYESVLARRLFHVKIMREPARPDQAKAYLAATHAWQPRVDKQTPR